MMFHWAANRDPAYFAAPGGFDVRRSPNPHIGVGASPAAGSAGQQRFGAAQAGAAAAQQHQLVAAEADQVHQCGQNEQQR